MNPTSQIEKARQNAAEAIRAEDFPKAHRCLLKAGLNGVELFYIIARERRRKLADTMAD